ncbi:MAG TPA: HAMP domain-containing sensor histidine kinase [Chiayiivirga sp.]|uniref:histidine kinase n=1 Tax=Denitratimonas tolerans TaxID=1338420 RepID=A0AAW9R926_9GAMM|nr:HAMP domain-containing histidine kinase [Xanthomonadaceae bacterium]MDX9764299.1 HAMP domain-containing sensor histidine kinase [Chiayiivirga sp.]MEB2315476.1 HAMP domain-containing sensor histidine kinase [Xanthomonadaceae bacterium]HMN35578.1 HAMP domain-containing sensor histidine kinase [Chiayiivirga sp.]HRN58937.1 HAMP domain-containing sensor histidine kinase [Chiayiivirga sp.]
MSDTVAGLPERPIPRQRLRARIVASFVLLGFGLTALFAASTLALRARIENQLVGAWLGAEATSYLEFKRAHPEPSAAYGLQEQQIEMFAFRPESPQIPLAWRDLPSGVHDWRDPDARGRNADFKLAVARAPDIVTYIKYGYGRQALSAQQLMTVLGVSVVAFTLLAWLIGLWSSRRVMRPVADLAARVEGFGGDVARTALAPHFAQDEVGQLAQALDDYADQLTERVARDREFNADVSHELRTPLAVIRGATELLLATPDLSEKMRQRLLRIERATQQSTDLTTALLMLSRNERGSGRSDVRRIVEAQAEANRVHLLNKPVRLRVDGQRDVFVDAPEAVLSVALNNLIGNACKYTLEGEVAVTVLADRVEVADSGPGIAHEDAERLFERGYRGSSSAGSKGAGIGLAIVRRLCDLYGWRVRLEPRTDRQGSRAILEFEPGPEPGHA